MHTLANSRLGVSILDADQACLDVLKSVPLEENDGFSLKMTAFTGFLPTLPGFDTKNGYFNEFLTRPKHS